jgi:hypothetical protein
MKMRSKAPWLLKKVGGGGWSWRYIPYTLSRFALRYSFFTKKKEI